jgi:hypothetical protein
MLTCTGGPSWLLIAPTSPEEPRTVTCWSRACSSAVCIAAASARVRECSPVLKLIETTAACRATPSWIVLVIAAMALEGLVAMSLGIRMTSRVAPGANACTISVSPSSSPPAR